MGIIHNWPRGFPTLDEVSRRSENKFFEFLEKTFKLLQGLEESEDYNRIDGIFADLEETRNLYLELRDKASSQAATSDERFELHRSFLTSIINTAICYSALNRIDAFVPIVRTLGAHARLERTITQQELVSEALVFLELLQNMISKQPRELRAVRDIVMAVSLAQTVGGGVAALLNRPGET